MLADRLYELAGCRDRAHWLRRLDRVMERPVAEGPAFALFVDGINQQPSAAWPLMLQVLQTEPFAGRVRVLVSTRQSHFEGRLARLRSLVVLPSEVRVEPYDLAPDGELDQMLAHEGLRRGDLRPELLEIARMPRLFALVVRFRDRLGGTEQVT